MARLGWLWIPLFATIASATTPSPTPAASGTGACTSANTATCCKPKAGKYCARIWGSDVKASNTSFTGTNPCFWANLGGQTEDTNSLWNFPNTNNFVCGSNDCNVAGSQVTSITSTMSSSANADTGTAYYGQVDSVANGTEMTKGVATAAGYYASFNVALSRYNCEEQYSHWNCDDCRKAYARWACAITIPQCAVSPCATTKPCVRVCNEVVQKCPVTLGFTCPDDNRDYGDSSCNLMGLTNGASSTQMPTIVAVAALAIAAIMAH